MKHDIEKCKKDSWKIQNVKCNNPHQFVQNVQRLQKCTSMFKKLLYDYHH